MWFAPSVQVFANTGVAQSKRSPDKINLGDVTVIKTNNALFRTAATAAILAGLAGTAAYAITDTNFTYTTPRPGFFTVNPMAFAEDGFSLGEPFTISWGSGTLRAGAAATQSQCFNTNVNLPAGARLTGLRTWTTSGASGGVFVRFESLALSTGVSTSIVNATVGNTSGNRVATLTPIPVSTPVINNTQAYGLGVCLDPDEQFNGARIEYTAVNAGD